MTNEEAAKRLEEQLAKETMYWGNYFESEVVKEVAHLAIAALNEAGSLTTQLDENGLMPCGCGGKAEFEPTYNEQYPVMAVCQSCFVRTDEMADEDWARQRWNRAMGYEEEE